MTHHGGWGHVIAVLDKYISLRLDWPITSPLGRLDDVPPEEANHDVAGKLAWVVDIGTCLERLDTDERDSVLEVAMLRQAENDAASRARNADMSARRSGVSDIRENHQRSKREWKQIADEHQRMRRNVERRRAYEHGMDRLSLLIVEVMTTHTHTQN
jgi:hypothetical protein